MITECLHLSEELHWILRYLYWTPRLNTDEIMIIFFFSLKWVISEVLTSPSWIIDYSSKLNHNSLSIPLQNHWLSKTICRLHWVSSLFFPVSLSRRRRGFWCFSNSRTVIVHAADRLCQTEVIIGFLSIISLGADFIVSETRRVTVTMADGSCYVYRRRGV